MLRDTSAASTKRRSTGSAARIGEAPNIVIASANMIDVRRNSRSMRGNLANFRITVPALAYWEMQLRQAFHRRPRSLFAIERDWLRPKPWLSASQGRSHEDPNALSKRSGGRVQVLSPCPLRLLQRR